jgi:hypothetical protein
MARTYAATCKACRHDFDFLPGPLMACTRKVCDMWARATLRLRQVASIAIAMCLLLSVPSAISANFTSDQVSVRISGEIVPGDAQRFAKFVLNNAGAKRILLLGEGVLFLSSPGGNVMEAMAIGRLLANTYIYVIVDKEEVCASACVLIFASAAERTIVGHIGLHRISTAGDGVDVSSAERLVKPALQSVEGYLLSRGFTRDLLDKMNSTPANEMHMIGGEYHTKKALDDIKMLSYEPTYYDVISRKCGKDPYWVKYDTGVKPPQSQYEEHADCVNNIRTQNSWRTYVKSINAFKAAADRR